jgi:hypothetical protein
LKLGAADQDLINRLSLEGLTFGSKADGALESGMRRFEAASLQLESGSLVQELGRLALPQLAGQIRIAQGRRRCAP